MPKGPFLSSQFVATQWSSQDDKAEFANVLLHFISSDFKQTQFTEKLYRRLSNTFGHIAHYDRGGFWETWFAQRTDQVRFVEHLLRWPCHGDPAFTFCDVERALQVEVQRRGLLPRVKLIADSSSRVEEMLLLEKLERKYRLPLEHYAAVVPDANRVVDGGRVAEEWSIPVQASLF